MGGRSAKRKGTRVENEIKNKFKRAGFECMRIPMSGASRSGLLPESDLVLKAKGVQFLVEVKGRKTPPKTFLNWLKGSDMVVIKPDYDEPVVFMTWATVIRLLGDDNE